MTIEAGPHELFTTLANERDIAGIVTLVNSAYRGTASRRGWTSEEHLIEGQRTSPDSILELLQEQGSVILLMRGQSALNACVHLRKAANDTTYLGMLSVRPAMQGSLFGRAMLASAETYARQHFAARAVEMTVINVREELIAWYERRGYARTGELRPFPYGDTRLGTPTRDDLKFVVLTRTIAS